MSRTTKELIEDAKAEALALKLDETETLADMGVFLVVGFEKDSKFIKHNEPDALTKLNDYIQQGGMPIGYITITKGQPGRVQVRTKVLPDHSGDAVAESQRLLDKLASVVGEGIKHIIGGGK